MTKSVEQISLGSMSPGTERFIRVHRYGTKGARPADTVSKAAKMRAI